MGRSLTERTVRAAEALDVYLRDRAPRSSVVDGCNEEAPRIGAADGQGPGMPDREVAPEHARAAATTVSRRTLLDGRPENAPLRLPHPDWLYHRLTITGPADRLEKFRVAAAGAGTVPWQLDLDRMQEDLFHVLAGAGQLSLEGARVLSGQVGEAVARRQALAVARVGRSLACPFDLQALVPVPDTILYLGPDHPGALAWLWAHWGTTEALRHVTEVGNTGQPTKETPEIRFWSADWTPWRALEKSGRRGRGCASTCARTTERVDGRGAS